jgi:hypothetical protein
MFLQRSIDAVALQAVWAIEFGNKARATGTMPSYYGQRHQTDAQPAKAAQHRQNR